MIPPPPPPAVPFVPPAPIGQMFDVRIRVVGSAVDPVDGRPTLAVELVGFDGKPSQRGVTHYMDRACVQRSLA